VLERKEGPLSIGGGWVAQAALGLVLGIRAIVAIRRFRGRW
jgi:hypothetical protein